MNRKAMAKETLEILEQGYYERIVKNEANQELEKQQISIKDDIKQSIEKSKLISPMEAEKIIEKYHVCKSCSKPEIRVENISTVEAVRVLTKEGKKDIAVLNFASAKNPGGGFLNGAKAQEESITVSSTLYTTLTLHEQYYKQNRANKSMMYLDYAIYSPEVVFFRDERFQLAEVPVKASVLTLPAVNMGQVILKGENVQQAKRVMRRRMKLALSIFAEQKAKHIVLGAYGCGVFRNDPKEVAAWWKELLEEEMGQYFVSVFHAVLDQSKEQRCIKAFLE
ncbi:TIGR02452 family protein [Clostridium sp. MD294]|uniref:TIGR02452 family protein n=1 Tax=Clostridium sp. MD294 TaxID=97138 RepID=UPI0002CBB529|nr:TIGR02452 family protein [Clostridium sp. MD294]NDO47815.1 TIGR02452 family protein [Clostridium sp. MD294]USF29865.1 hypothetical protein C820_001273 [Clostridium sp. MD294]